MSDQISQAVDLVGQALDIQTDGLSGAETMDSLDRWDSIGHMRIALAIEEKLGRRLDPLEVANLFGVSDVAQLLNGAG